MFNKDKIKLFAHIICKHEQIEYCKETNQLFCDSCNRTINEGQIEEILKTRNAI